MGLVDWLALAGIAVYPPLIAYAYWDYRRGGRDWRSFVRSNGPGGVGLAVLLQQASMRWLETPADDVVAVVSMFVLGAGLYAMYVGYVRGVSEDSGMAQSE